MTTAETVLLTLAILWVLGWLATLRSTGTDKYATPWERAGWVAWLFFLWPFYAFA